MTTNYGPTTIWFLIIATGIATYGLRLSFVSLFGRLEEVPAAVQGVLRYVPAAVLAALVVTAMVSLTVTPHPALVHDPAELLAAVIGLVVAWRTEDVLATTAVGLIALWTVNWLL